MHSINLHDHIHGLAARDAPAAASVQLDSARTAFPNLSEIHGGKLNDFHVGDFGVVLNITDAAEPFSMGLAGVNQVQNYLLANTLIFAFIVLATATLAYRWSVMGKRHARHLLTMGTRDQQRYWSINGTTLWPKLKQHLIYAPLFRVRHNRELQLSKAIGNGTLPGRFHTLLLSVYVSANIAYCFVLSYGDPFNETMADLRGRSGVLAALNIIPTVLFALRNNPLITILGVSYDTFNLFHRWIARLMVAEAIVHTIAWAINAMQGGGLHQLYLNLSTSVSYTWGMVGTAVFSFVIIQASSPIRHAFYETFLNAHRILVFVALVGVYIHLDKAGLPQVPWLALAFALWGGEWAFRIVRILYYNVSLKTGITKITVEALPSEACRVTFDLARPWTYKPGCHVHAYLPMISLWSSHPFSVAWVENRARGPQLDIEKVASHNPSALLEQARRPSVPSRMSSYQAGYQARSRASTMRASTFGEKDSKDPRATVAELESQATAIVPGQNKVTTISLIMRARTGMTRKLYNKAANTPKGYFTTWGGIEGPYGGHEPLKSYGTVVLFAGGVGITHCIGYIQQLLSEYAQGTCSTRKILLVWSVPNTEALEWIHDWMNVVLKMEHRRDVLRIFLFVTKPRSRNEVLSNTGTVQMFPGRANPQTIIDKEVAERVGAMAVSVCGPGAFADSVRLAARNRVQDGAVDFIEEAFTY